MSYKKPMCLCGEELYLWEQVYTTNEYRILKSGKQKKKPSYSTPYEQINEARLKCYGCNTEYEYIIDDKGRHIRKDIMNEGDIRFEEEDN
jgi:hypothetical protein